MGFSCRIIDSCSLETRKPFWFWCTFSFRFIIIIIVFFSSSSSISFICGRRTTATLRVRGVIVSVCPVRVIGHHKTFGYGRTAHNMVCWTICDRYLYRQHRRVTDVRACPFYPFLTIGQGHICNRETAFVSSQFMLYAVKWDAKPLKHMQIIRRVRGSFRTILNCS